MVPRWLGIDFSGNDRMWRPGCTVSNVWVAEVCDGADGAALVALSRVQEMARGSARPFEWLCSTLSLGQFAAAAIDAPFSVPARFVGSDGHAGLVARVGRRAPPRGRPFLRGEEFVKEVTGCDPPLSPPKPYRATEQRWREKKVETRSTLWVTPRGGAPMTAACIRLLHLANRPIWPWSDRNVGGTLVEGFPAAQLCQWGLPHEEYSDCGRAATETRRDTILALKARLSIPSDLEPHMLASADALDAVVCAFAAIAITTRHVAQPPALEAHLEGWIAVHR